MTPLPSRNLPCTGVDLFCESGDFSNLSLLFSLEGHLLDLSPTQIKMISSSDP